jgi:hypothetical protein
MLGIKKNVPRDKNGLKLVPGATSMVYVMQQLPVAKLYRFDPTHNCAQVKSL